MEERGVVYGVSGLAWLQETILSGFSLKRTNPDLPSELFIDQQTIDLLPNDIDLSPYFKYINVESDVGEFRTYKFKALSSRRFRKTFFLDVDTYINDDISEIFDLLDQFDLAAMVAQQRVHNQSISSGIVDLLPDVPISFPEYNAGVIAFNNDEKFTQFLESWMNMYQQGVEHCNYLMDQASLRPALYHSDLRIATLTQEYNMRAGVPNVLRGKAKIIHAHGQLEQISSLVNINHDRIRIWNPRPELVHGFTPQNYDPNNEDADMIRGKIISEIRSTINRLNRIS